ncbi:MAG: DUF3047 domain-containing protein [Candidatus Rokubacteria bacterium]|nr:DUF3047 domain-containing protein [Candidatus Rokubacteria bacterium]
MSVRLVIALLAAALLVGPADAEECVTVENFSRGKVGEFPPDWKPRKDAGREVYSVQEMDGLRFLHAIAKGLGIQAAKEYGWDPKAYPMLAWSWRPVEFPAGSDERKSKTNDSAVSIYAVFPHTPWSVKSLKYVWSAVVPVGMRLSSSAGLTQALVIRSGTDRKGSWTEERVNIFEDFKKFFDETETPKTSGIAVLTDSDDTKSTAQGDYANFRLCKP